MKKLTIILLLTLLASCSQKRNSVKANVATISGVEVGACPQTGTVTQTVYGTIYDSTQSSYDFENRVKALLSVNLQPSEIGSISPMEAAQTGVRFNGVVKLDASGNVVGAQSNVIISIWDDIAIYQSQQPIKIVFNPNSGNGASITGQFNTSSGEGYISMRDSYGEVRFEGRIDAQKLSGIVKFQNTVNVTGSTPAGGTLGQFYIQRCAFLQ